MKLANTDAIFIVDDDTNWLKQMNQMLISLGYVNIKPYINGEECLFNLHRKPRLIFLDEAMKMSNGVEVLPLIKQAYPNVVVIFCSDKYDIGASITAVKKGSFDYVLKSCCNVEKLFTLINEMNQESILPD